MRSRISVLNYRNSFQARLQIGLAGILLGSILAGCSSESGHSTPPPMSGSEAVDLDAELVRAAELGKPIIILVTESGQSRADDDARTLSQDFRDKDGTLSVLLDISISRNRATATRFHITNTPVLMCLSPKGLIVSRDEAPITQVLLSKRIAEVAQKAPVLDSRLDVLAQAANQNPNDAPAQFELANFLLAQQNEHEAIPHLEIVARNEAADLTLRIRAWTALARAHLWVAEPEKGRHEAEGLITILGPKTADARAAGDLILGIQDATAKRAALARREFGEATLAAPDSVYGRQAAEELAKLPGATK